MPSQIQPPSERQWHVFVNREYGVDGKRLCSLALHPTTSGVREDGTPWTMTRCLCGAYAHRQCCVDYTPCAVHKCGPRKGCRCPLPEPTDG
jgi:hypothetical protein